jgi:hypothetical protein
MHSNSYDIITNTYSRAYKQDRSTTIAHVSNYPLEPEPKELPLDYESMTVGMYDHDHKDDVARIDYIHTKDSITGRFKGVRKRKYIRNVTEYMIHKDIHGDVAVSNFYKETDTRNRAAQLTYYAKENKVEIVGYKCTLARTSKDKELTTFLTDAFTKGDDGRDPKQNLLNAIFGGYAASEQDTVDALFSGDTVLITRVGLKKAFAEDKEIGVPISEWLHEKVIEYYNPPKPKPKP